MEAENRTKSPSLEPRVSLLLVVRNERASLLSALESLVRQDYPKSLLEIIVVDGMSTDGTREAAIRYLEKLKQENYCCRFIDNPKKILASGWNIGLENMNGDYLCRIDAHATIESEYVRRGIALISQAQYDQIAAVGGVLSYKTPTTFWGNIVVQILSSRFGVGNSPFRIPPKEVTHTDTAMFGLYRRDLLLRVGGFDETMQRGQDTGLHKRLRREGWAFLTNPEMKAVYEPRSTFRKLLRQGFFNGYWLAFSGGHYRHYAPFIFFMYVIGLLLSATCIGPGLPLLLLAVPLLFYVLLSILFAFKDGKGMLPKLILPFLFFSYHITYGAGIVIGYHVRFFKAVNCLFTH